jgi:hypothetical protein
MSEEELPVFSSERILPPTEANLSVSVKGDWVELQVTKNSREVYDFLWMNPDQAENVADELREVANQIDSE